ncbi:MAG: D-Ala-D-Ala carboxypeptidase family metallohydrolase [Oscillibacter sp.]|jgi:hypothetical protein|nr:D-Ala-D-Ala carboxypeptidase family metallohydrolase [Oscillibacter sp.]
MVKSGTIALADIERIQIYVNSKKYKETQLATILKAAGGDLIFNGTIFSWNTYKPVCPTKADGIVLCSQPWKAYGVSWNTPADFSEAVVADSKSNYICCVPLIIKGQKKDKPNYQPDMGGSRPRTAIGVKQGRFAYYVTSGGITPEKLRDTLFSAGWSHATMLDGGGSTCFRDASGGFCCDGSRVVQHYIIIHKKKAVVQDTEPKGAKPMITINAYSLAKDGDKKLSANFAVREFKCSDGTDPIFIAPDLVTLLQKIRTHYGKAVNIASAYRTVSKNRIVGGVEYSQHLYGTAADITIKGVTPKALATYIETLIPKTGGIGVYDNDRQGHFVHVDVREVRARW